MYVYEIEYLPNHTISNSLLYPVPHFSLKIEYQGGCPTSMGRVWIGNKECGGVR